MPVKLYTGLPGAGKTLALVKEMLDLETREPGRPVFAYGINGLKEGIAAPLAEDEVKRWDELPPGAIVCIDECQELMPTERGNTPDWIRKLSKVRHHGIDFLLTTQHPTLMSAYVRRLVDQHVHLVRKFNTGVVDRYQWGRCMDDPEKRHSQKAAVNSLWTHPKEVFDCYKSASLHTMKKRIPAKVYYFVALVVLALGAVASVPLLVKRAQRDNLQSISGKAPGQEPDTVSGRGEAKPDDLRTRDYAAWMRPRLPGVPWSAPMFDQLQVRAVPRLFCMAVETGECGCMTEQGTKYEVPANVCRRIASDGMYNPFVDASQGDRESRGARQVSTAGPAIPAETPTTGLPGPTHERATATAYQPPEFGQWNPDALAHGGR